MASGTIRTDSWVPLLASTSISGTGSKTLTDNVANYSALCFFLNNGTEWKPYYIPTAVLANNTFDVSWNATDSVSWYIIITVQFNGTTMSVAKFTRRGFTTSNVMVYGIK